MLLAKFDLKEYARRGALARVEELRAELAEIYRAFPALRSAQGGRRRAGVSAAESEAAGTPGPGRRRSRRRSRMTAEQRKAVSARMKKYWAERRKAKTSK